MVQDSVRVKTRRLRSGKMEELQGLMRRFEGLVYDCTREISHYNECTLVLGKAECDSQRQKLVACQAAMRRNMDAVTSACGKQHSNFNACMTSAAAEGSAARDSGTKCVEALAEFVHCSERVMLARYERGEALAGQ